MKILTLTAILTMAVILSAGEVEDGPKPVTPALAITIQHCHPGDWALVHVLPIPESPTRPQGWFTTTNEALSLSDLSMLPSGLNRLEIRTVCRGLTSEVTTAVFDLQRPPPKPRIGRRMLSRTNVVHMPPLPGGMQMALPGAPTNQISYSDQTAMNKYFTKQGRRSQ